MGSPWDIATVPTRHLRDVVGSGVCYLGRDRHFLLLLKFYGIESGKDNFSFRPANGDSGDYLRFVDYTNDDFFVLRL